MGQHLNRPHEFEEEPDFGTFLKLVRTTKRIRQGTIAALLAANGWTPTTYTRLENSGIAPRFADLLPLYRAFVFAGVSFSLADRQQFVERARARIERKRTHRETHSDAEWAQLRYELARVDGLSDLPLAPVAQARVPHKPLLAETGHLIGRDAWREEVLACFGGPTRVKLIVMHGPAGIGKSSELNWLATYFLRQSPTMHRVILCDLHSLAHTSGPEDAFQVFAGTLLSELGSPQPPTPFPSLEEQAQRLLEQLEKARLSLVVFLDHAECLLQTSGELAPCWEHFLRCFLRGQQNMTLALASKEWPGWYHGEQQFVAHHLLPPLSREQSLLLLQQQGLDSVPVALLERVYEQVGGIPLALEWVAALVKQPLEVEDWDAFESDSRAGAASISEHAMTSAIERLLAEPHIFGGTLADDIAPLLQRIIATQHLSPEARTLLEVLSVARIPLAKPALQLLCPQGPRPLKELRRASVLVSYPERIQLLPMVAAAMYRHLSAEQRKEREVALIEACQAWREAGILDNRERGVVVTELLTLLIKHHRLVEAVVLLMLDGWLSFNLGNGPLLAQYAQKRMQQFDWQSSTENRCAGMILQHRLCPYLGQPINEEQRARDYRTIYDAILTGTVVLPPNIELFVTHRLMSLAIQASRFEEAIALLKVRCERLYKSFPISLLEDHAFLYGKWSDYAQEQGDIQEANKLREETITFYKECCTKLATRIAEAPLNSTLRKLGGCLNNLGYHLNRAGRYEEALQAVEECLTWREQGYVEFGGLAASYGEKSQILMELGRFQEALLFDEKAVAEVERCAKTGHTSSQEEIWIYRVNRGRLCLRIGKVNEAERLLREAIPHISKRRRIYQMFAEDALEEIEQWRQKTTASHYQLDWRWIERYRQLITYDAFWWWVQAGPFTEEERQEWNQHYIPSPDKVLKEQLGKLISRSCWRELRTSVAEQRQPCLHYPALEVDEIRRRIAALQTLDTEISQQEPNAIVRRLYHGAIENEINFLGMIVATYEGNSELYKELNRRLGFEPTRDEMDEALGYVKRTLQQGLKSKETEEVSQQVIQFLQERFQLSFDLSSGESVAIQEVSQEAISPSSEPQRMVTAQTAKRFFEAVLRDYGYEGWHVIVDSAARVNRVEGAARHLFLRDGSFSLDTIRHLFAHEFAGHVARSTAGERSKLGLLGIGTKNYTAIEEGLIAYQEQQAAVLYGKTVDREGIWLGTLATGLAGGIVTPPQTFLELFTFLEQFYLLRNLLEQPQQAREVAHDKAQNRALSRCLRTYRGVPDLEQAGVWYGMDVSYLRGQRAIKQAVAEDATVLDRLAVGKIGLDALADMQELGIVSTPQPLKTLAYDPALEHYILSFEMKLDGSP